jgi:hypothetical protein
MGHMERFLESLGGMLKEMTVMKNGALHRLLEKIKFHGVEMD